MPCQGPSRGAPPAGGLPGASGGGTLAAVRVLRVLRERGEAISARVRDEVTGALRAERSAAGGPSPAAQVRAAQVAHAVLDGEGGRARSLVHAPACSAGCSWCCHVHAYATGPEILAVAAYLGETLPAGALEALRERLERHVERADRLSDDERWAARIPCALLDAAGRCTVHPARPLRCRAFHSCSVDACRDAFDGLREAPAPTSPALDRANDAVEDGYDRALADAGLSPAGERLEAGLLAALRAHAGTGAP